MLRIVPLSRWRLRLPDRARPYAMYMIIGIIGLYIQVSSALWKHTSCDTTLKSVRLARPLPLDRSRSLLPRERPQ